MSKRLSRAIHGILLMLMGLLLNFGCAAKKLAINNADTILEYQLEKRLPLTSSQKEVLSKDVDGLLNQHRAVAKELMPIIGSIDLSSEQKLGPQYHQFLEYYEMVSAAFTKLICKHMAELDPKQQKKLFETLEEENEDLAEKDADDQMDKLKSRFISFFGSISDEQKKLLTQYRPEMEERHRLRLERRKKLHKQFKEIYARDVSSETRQGLFFEAFREYQGHHRHAKNLEIAKAFLPTFSKEQIKHFKNQLAEVKEMLGYFIEAEY